MPKRKATCISHQNLILTDTVILKHTNSRVFSVGSPAEGFYQSAARYAIQARVQHGRRNETHAANTSAHFYM